MNGPIQSRRFFKRKHLWTLFYAVYLSLILFSIYGLIAQETVDTIRSNMDEKYTYALTFYHDGITTHYDVTRHDTSAPGRITLTYWTADNKLDITNVENVKTLKINVKSLFEDEAQDVFKKTPAQMPNLDMDYWLDAGDGIFTVQFTNPSVRPLEKVSFTKFPTPNSVLVNNQEWWKTKANYSTSGSEITISNIPKGKTTVIIYFKTPNQLPVPSFETSPAQYAGVNENITFNGSASTDPDGQVMSWLWNFGDSSYESGVVVHHSYSKPGNYTIRLTVRDNAEPFGEAWTEKILTVRFGAQDDTDSDGLRDAWEWDQFKSLDETADGDYDNDGASNLEEYESSTDPTNPLSKPVEKGEPEEEGGFNMMLIIAVVVIIIAVMVVMLFVMRTRKSSEAKERQAMTVEMEAKIAKAKKLGLPTRDLERLLKEARTGKGELPTKGPAGKKPQMREKGTQRDRMDRRKGR